MIKLRTHLIVRCLVPYASAIATDFDTLWPVPSTAVSPAAHVDGAIMNENVFLDRMHDRRRDGHVLDGEAVGVGGVVLADLRAIVEILFLLDRRCAGRSDSVDTGEPLAASTFS